MLAFFFVAVATMSAPDYERCAIRIVEALKLQPGEAVLLKADPLEFTPILEPLQREIRRAGAHVLSTVLTEITTATSEAELDRMRVLLSQTDVLIWLPERTPGNAPAFQQALAEWLDGRRGRALHFHWGGGTLPVRDLPLPEPEVVDRMYLDALQVKPSELEPLQDAAIGILRSGIVRVTTPEGTDLTFQVGDRPFSKQIGDASRERMKHARTRIDRDVELPAGALRVAPLETSANGTLVLPVWKPIAAEGRSIRLTFQDGRVVRIEGRNADAIDRELTAAGGASKMFREFALGFNPRLAVPEEGPFIPYYGYGAGVVRLSLGDNEEMGGANRGGGVYWNFLPNATVSAGGKVLVRDGRLLIP